MIYQTYIKRLMDIFCSALALIFLLPIFIIVFIMIKLDTRGPAIFTQDRVGKYGKEFKIYKFRTMLTFEDSYYPDGTPIENYDRITKVGKILRKTSIDELPQIINIFIGNMSIVGPRPTLSYQVDKYDEIQARRLNVKPGLTGLAQISGRNSITWEEKIAYDLDYVNKISFLGDVFIIIKTIFVIFESSKTDFTKHDTISQHAGDVREDLKV